MRKSLPLLVATWLLLVGCDGDPAPFDCAVDGCEAGTHCDAATANCVPDCIKGACGEGYCDPDTRECAAYLAFADPALSACVEAAAGVLAGMLTAQDARRLTDLSCPDLGITSLAGIGQLNSLERLSIWENAVSDLTPLGGLTGLVELQAGFNDLSDVTPLIGLTGLKRLGLAFNHLTDAAPLASLPALVQLNLDTNGFEELSPLAGLTNLRWLSIEENPLTDDAVLDALSAGGCEVYAGFAAGKRRGSAPSPAGAGAADPSPAFAGATGCARPTLRARTAPDGSLTLSATCADEVLAVRAEDGGVLRVEDGAIFWTRGRDRVRVGRLEVDGPVWMPGATGCRLLFSTTAGAGAAALPSVRPVLTTRLQCPPRLHKDAAGDGHVFGLEPELLPSPNQFDAGSCLFMATTGAVEILLNQHVDGAPASEGDTDLGERWLMNAYQDLPGFAYFITDLFSTFPHFGRTLRNPDLRFTADWVVEDENGGVRPVPAGTPDSFLSCRVNWAYELPGDWESRAVDVPEVGRTLIFVDPDLDENSIWNVGIMNGDVVERVKHELRTKNAPVLVVYNHFLYWHAVLIVGYDDGADAGDCPFVRDSIDYYREQGAAGYATKIESAMATQGGCNSTGVFFVRDSIYDGGSSALDYTYNEELGVVDKYSATVVTHEYDWLRYLGNHAYTLHRR